MLHVLAGVLQYSALFPVSSFRYGRAVLRWDTVRFGAVRAHIFINP
jgi:hypothetical protein